MPPPSGGPARKGNDQVPEQLAEDPSGVEPAPQDPPRRPRWTRWALFGAPVLVLILAAGALVAFRDDEPVPSTTTSTTTTEAPSTTTTVPVLPAGTVEIATAKASLDAIEVRAQEPDGWSTTPLSVRTQEIELPPASQASMPERPALPRAGFPIVGREATPEGWRFHNPGPYDPPQPFTMLVVERRGEWARVHVPVRPNGTHGWVRLDQVDLTTTRHRIDIRLGERMLRAYDGDELLAETRVVIGAPGTPTPTGVFHITDIVPQLNPAGAYGPVALATDGYSEAMDSFDGGVPVIALHGTNRPALVGQAVANGCVRVPNGVIELLALTLPRGTPVYIWP